MLKEFLSAKGIAYRDRDITRDPTALQDLKEKAGSLVVPVIVIDSEVVIGFNQTRLEELLSQKQQATRPSLGASIADAAKVAAKQGGWMASGVFIGSVRAGSTAEKIGLVPGDVITGINARIVATADDLQGVISGMAQGDHISLTVLRKGESIKIEGTL